ncbi:MAG: replication factor C large subunit [Candidatus Diapherotrites archaeon]
MAARAHEPAPIWTEKFRPSSFAEFIGNPQAAEQAQKWAQEWVSRGRTGGGAEGASRGEGGNKPKPLLLFGQSGSGKTALAYLLARSQGWDVFELNASDFRNEEMIERLAGAASQGASFSGKPRLVLLDEVDGLQAVDRGGAAAMVKIIREAQNPVILTANDIYSNRKLAPMRTECTLVEFKKINYLSIAKRLREICVAEGIKFDDEAIALLAKNSSGDFRAALLDLQSLAQKGSIEKEDVETLGTRERTEKIFTVLDKIFKGKTLKEIRSARMGSEISGEMVMNWVDENIPLAFPLPEDTAGAYESLSRADVFNGRIMKRQNWGFLRYSSELATSGVSIGRKNAPHGFIMYKFPSMISRMGRSKGVRATKKNIALKVGKQTHSGVKSVIKDDLPYLRAIFENKPRAAELTAQFCFDENEVAFLMGTKPETKKVQKVLEEAEVLRTQRVAEKRKVKGAFAAVSEEDATAEIPEKKETEIPAPPHDHADSSQTKLF